MGAAPSLQGPFVHAMLRTYSARLIFISRFAQSPQPCGALDAKVYGTVAVIIFTMCATLTISVCLFTDHLHIQDWPRHKNECLTVAALSPSPVEPSPSMPFTVATFAAIIFPVDETRPRIIHVECLAFIEPSSSLMNWTPRVREHMQAGPHDTIGSLTIETGISEGE